MTARIEYDTSGNPLVYTNTIDLAPDADVDRAIEIVKANSGRIDSSVKIGADLVRVYYGIDASTKSVADLRECDHKLRMALEDAVPLAVVWGPADTSSLNLKAWSNVECSKKTIEAGVAVRSSAQDALAQDIVAQKTVVLSASREIADLEHQLVTVRTKLAQAESKVTVFENCLAMLRA